METQLQGQKIQFYFQGEDRGTIVNQTVTDIRWEGVDGQDGLQKVGTWGGRVVVWICGKSWIVLKRVQVLGEKKGQ